MNENSFKPQGAMEARIMSASGPQLGRQFALGSQENGANSFSPAGQATAPAQISAPNAPKGAQPVALAGMPQQAAPRAPFLAPPQPQQADGYSSVHRIRVVGLGQDGRRYLAEYDVDFQIPARVVEIVPSVAG